MATLLRLCVFWLLTAAALPVAAAGVIFQQVTAADYQLARKVARACTAATTFPVHQQAGRLTIPTSAGPLVLQDQAIGETEVAQGLSEDQETHYTYRGYLLHFQRHLVEVTRYETTEWWLIAENGRRLTSWGPPVYAPDQNSIVTISAGLDYSGGQPNAVQLFQLKNGLLQKVWETRPTTWEPQDIFWASSRVLYLKRTAYSGSPGSVSYWKLTIT